MFEVFVCYARHDEEFVVRLAKALSELSVPLWLDQWHIPPGEDWDHSIDQALDRSTAVLLVLSPAAVRSREVRSEIRVALDADKPIVPVLFEECVIPRQLRLLQYSDLSGGFAQSKSQISTLAERLLALVPDHSSAPRSPTPPSGGAPTDPTSSARRTDKTGPPSWVGILVLPVLLGVGIWGIMRIASTGEAGALDAVDPRPQPVPDVSRVRTAVVKGTRADPQCMAPWDTNSPAVTLTVGARSFERRGTLLKEKTQDGESEMVLGVLANIKEDSYDNIANIRAALRFFRRQNAEAILVAGDSGESEQQIQSALEAVAEIGLPVFVVIGNRESRFEYWSAVTALSHKRKNVFDLNQLRRVELDGVTLVSLPGYYDRAYLHSEDGCEYFSADVADTANIIREAPAQPWVLVSHGGPRQQGTEALDRTLERANIGDRNLNKMISSTATKFGVFANVQEAGGRATDAKGRYIAPGTWADELFLNPGAIDSVSWQMNDGTRSEGMVATLKLRGSQASYEVYRVPTRR